MDKERQSNDRDKNESTIRNIEKSSFRFEDSVV